MSNDSTTKVNANDHAASPKRNTPPARAATRKAAHKRKPTNNCEVEIIAKAGSMATGHATRQIAFSEFDEWGLPVDRRLFG